MMYMYDAWDNLVAALSPEKGGSVQFKLETVLGCKRLWVVMVGESGEFIDSLPVMRLLPGIKRRVERKKRRLLRIHERLVELGYRK